MFTFNSPAENIQIDESSQSFNHQSDKTQVNEPEFKMPKGKTYFWFSIICLMMLVDIMDRAALGAVLPMIKDSFHLTDAQAGMVSSIFGVTIALMAVPVGLLADKWSRTKMISIMVAFWSLATAATGAAKSLSTFTLARLGVGAGEAGYGSVAYSLISAWFPKRQRGIMIGIFHAFTPLGIAVGLVTAGTLAFHYGWRTCFGILTIPGLILAVLAWFMPDFKVKVIDNNPNKMNLSSTKSMFAYIFKSPTVIAAFFIAACTLLANCSLGTWGTTLFVRTFDMNIKEASKAIALATLLGVFGGPLLGKLGDVLLKRTNKGRLIAMVISGLGFLLAIILGLQNAMHAANYKVVFICWTLSYFFIMGIPVNVGALIVDLIPAHFRALATGFVPLFNQFIGGIWGPILAGVISDRYGLAFGIQSISILSMTLVMLFISMGIKFYNRDFEKVKSVAVISLDKA